MAIPIKTMSLTVPDRNEIAELLQRALNIYYTEASVRLVFSPDLSQAPFNLVAEGICGNTALLDCGDESYFNGPYRVYDFEQILKDTGRNRKNSFIFGHGVSKRITRQKLLSEIVLNALFLPETNNGRESTSTRFTIISTGFTIIDSKSKRCKKEMLDLSQLRCSVRGTYFLSEGSRTEPILQVSAKGPYLNREPFCGSKRFIYTMQHALEQTYGSAHFVALGGVYLVSGVFWNHESIRNWWEPTASTCNSYCFVNGMFETMITTFNSSAQVNFRDPPPIRLSSCRSIHSLTHHSSSEGHCVIYPENLGEEYLGYFCPAKTLYRVDEPPQ